MGNSTDISLLDRTLRNLRSGWGAIANAARGKSVDWSHPDLPDDDLARLREQLKDCLEGRGGEVSARARAADISRAYLSLNEEGRRRFLCLLARDFNLEPEPVDAAMEAVRAAAPGDQRHRTERCLREALRPPRYKLFAQFTTLPEGVKFLVDLRADLLRLSRELPELEVPEQELKSLLSGWFDVGFLELARIKWSSPAALLEKLIAYEAVHAINDWEDLKNRLQSDRRCFAFFHPRMPDEPLIFVEVALVNGIADNVQVLLDKSAPVLDPQAADTAIFYSISNAQRGLGGISFGNFLIKRVVDLLATEFKGLKTFSTLSPVPGFQRWLTRRVAADEPDLLAPERKRLAALDAGGDTQVLLKLLDGRAWVGDSALEALLQPILLRFCALYLYKEKVRNRGAARNPVAHFHLSNGARIERLNWMGDTSANGLSQSFGIMVNYLYKLGEIEANHEAYTGSGRIKVSSAVRGLLRG